MGTAWDLLKETFNDWSEDKAPRLAAALAYYTVFALAPILVIAIAVAGFVFGQEAAQGQIVGQIRGLVGEQGAEGIQAMIVGASKPSTGILATVLGVITLLFAASGLFGELQDALNTIWEVQPKPDRGILGTIKDRFLSLTMVLGVGFLLLVSLVLSSVLAAFGSWFGDSIFWALVNGVVSFGVVTVLFALIFKLLPDVKIAWSDVWIGAAATALLFTLGKFLIGLYLGRASTDSTYGAAGSLVIVLLWVYYSAQILFMGAEFTQVYARRYGSQIEPAENAVSITEEARAQQGIPRKAQVAAMATKQDKDATSSSESTEQDADPSQPSGRKPGLVGTIAGVIVGLALGKRLRGGAGNNSAKRS